jgi:predicted O-methyltransferase YrrM
MDSAVTQVLADFESRYLQEQARKAEMPAVEFNARVDEFLLPVGPVVGQLLHTLITGLNAQHIIEVGSSYGYSTVWLAAAAQQTGGTVVSLEVHAGKQAAAKEAIAKAGLSAQVRFVLGDAMESIGALTSPVDFALIDLWKPLYIPAFTVLYPKLITDAIVVADNMITPAPEQAQKYMDYVAGLSDVESVMLPLREGILVSRKC